MGQTLQNKIDAHGNVIDMLRNAPTGPYIFPVPSEHTNWRDEQWAWSQTAVLFDQSYHMSDIAFRGPDVAQLLAENTINNYTNFHPNKAFQFTACAENGAVISDAIGITHKDGSVSIIGKPTPGEYIAWRVEEAGYDIEIIRDARTIEGNTNRRFYRFQLHGPAAFDIFAKAIGAPLPDVRFFGIVEFEIAGCHVTGLRHGMTGGQGMEFWGPFNEHEKVLDAMMQAGASFGMRRGGARAYSSSAPYSGWVGSVLPAIYSGDDMAGFRTYLPAASFEGTLSLGGSLIHDDIASYYFDPWDLGYNRFIHWDHDFHGRDALLAKRDGPHRKKVWLHWNADDVMAIFASQIGDEPRAKFLEWPCGNYANSTFDAVQKSGITKGVSINPTYTVDAARWFSIGIVEEDIAAVGTSLTVIWGEPDGGTDKPTVEPHVQHEVRVTVADSPVN